MARKIKVDMSNVEEFVKAAEGQHKAKIEKVEEKTSSSGSDMLVVQFRVTSGVSKGALVYNNYVLTDKALWRFSALLKALGMKNKGKLAVDLDMLEGKSCVIEVAHEEYNGSMKARINDVYPVEADEDLEDDEDEEDEEVPVKKAPAKKATPAKKAAKKVEDDEEDDEDEEWED